MSTSSTTHSITRQVAFPAPDMAEIERSRTGARIVTLRLLGDNPDGHHLSLADPDAGRTSLDDLSIGDPSSHLRGGGVRIDRDLLEEVAATMTGATSLRFTSSEPVSRDAARRWQETVEHVRRTLVGRAGEPVSPLVVGESTRFLAAMALATFPHATMDPDGPATKPAGGQARDLPITAETVRGGVSFIEERADEDLSVADIAAAAGVTPRALQLAFRRHLETTPMSYLRQVRLERVHEELRLAGPGDGVTVTEVAGKWGFSGTSRFTSYYREAYGVAPSQTLAS